MNKGWSSVVHCWPAPSAVPGGAEAQRCVVEVTSQRLRRRRGVPGAADACEHLLRCTPLHPAAPGMQILLFWPLAWIPCVIPSWQVPPCTLGAPALTPACAAAYLSPARHRQQATHRRRRGSSLARICPAVHSQAEAGRELPSAVPPAAAASPTLTALPRLHSAHSLLWDGATTAHGHWTALRPTHHISPSLPPSTQLQAAPAPRIRLRA